MIPVSILTNTYDFIGTKSNDKYYGYKLALLLFLLACFFSTPNVFLFFLQDNLSSAWNTVIFKSNNLTSSLSHIDPYSWQAKKVFRLTIPLLIKLFNLPPYIIVLLQIFVGYLIFLFSYKLAFRISKDSIQATFFTAGIAFLYFGKASFFEFKATWFDGFSYFFIIMAMWSRGVLGIIIFSTLAAWNDERGFMALSLVFLFHYFDNIGLEKISFRNFLNFKKNTIAVFAAIFFYIVGRLIMSNLYNMHTPNDGANLGVLLDRTYYFIPIGLLTFFEGFYFLLAVFILFMVKSKDYLRLSFVAVPLLLITIVSFCVTDITRSGAFAFPIVFISIYYLKDKLAETQMRAILLICCMVSILIPPIFICADWGIERMLPKFSLFQVLDILKTL